MSENSRSPLASGRGRRAAVCLAVACLWIIASGKPAAAQVSYLYNGNTFNLFSCGGNTLCSAPNPSNTSYRTSNFVTAVLTLAEPLPPNLFMQDVTGHPGFRLIMADGHQMMTATAGYAGGFEAKVSTDADGLIIAPWNLIINCCQFPNNGISSVNSPFGVGIPGARGVGDSGRLGGPTFSFPNTPNDSGHRFGAPGAWSVGPSGTATRTILRASVNCGGLYDYDFIRAGARDFVPIGANGPPLTSSWIFVIPAGAVHGHGRLTEAGPSTGAYASTSGGGFPSGHCSTSAEAAGRGVAYQTRINTSNVPLTFKIKAILDGKLANAGRHAFAGVYLFKSKTFSDTIIDSGRTPAEFLLRRDDLLRLARAGDPFSSQPTLSLATLFPPEALLASKTQLVGGPPDQALEVPLTTGSVTLNPQESVTIMFDLAVFAPPGGYASFGDTLRPAPDFITDEFGNAVTDLVAVGPTAAPPPPPASLTLAPATATSAAGTAQSVTARARAADGSPVSDALVTFSITSGPNAGLTEQIPTDADGEATLAYVGTAPGTDSIQASTPALQSDAVTNTWTAGALDHITISPARATIAPGGSQAYTAEAFDIFNNSRGDVTGSTAFSILPDGSCAGAVCSATTPGAHTVTGTHNGMNANAALTVVAAASSYVFEGFFRPIDMSLPGRTVWNVVSAGQTIPAKWRLTRDGSPVSDPASFAGLASYPVDCASGAGPVGGSVAEPAPGSSGLSYKGDGHWQHNWKTPNAYKGTCRVLFVRFEDGTTGPGASFRFK
jgi:hypothetical protein